MNIDINKNIFITSLFSVLCFLFFITSTSAAEDLIKNGGFENYDTQTMLPDDWQVTEGLVKISTRYAEVSDASIYTPGGTYADGVDTPNEVQTGTIEQLIDLSEFSDWDTANLSATLSCSYKRWGTNRLSFYLDYLPSYYNDQVITLDDEAWDGPAVANGIRFFGSRHAGSRRFWENASAQRAIPKVRWARVRITMDSTFDDGEDFEDGEYVSAVDNISLEVEVIEPEAECSDNVLVNPGFESVSGGILPDSWTVITGQISDMDTADIPPYAGSRYVGVIGGTITYDEEDNLTDTPYITGRTVVAQVVDLSELYRWEYSDSTILALSGWLMSMNIGDIRVRIESLPEAYNDTSISADAAEWKSDDAKIVLEIEPSQEPGFWNRFETNQVVVSGVRWLRVSLNFADIGPKRISAYYLGQYLAGFDQLCMSAELQEYGDVLVNSDFEEAENGAPDVWQADPSGSQAEVMTSDPLPAYSGESWLGKTGADGVARYYQVIDMANKIAYWLALDESGNTIEYRFIKYELSAALASAGGAGVSIAMEYLPYSYNETEDITWDDEVWEARSWVSDGTGFTNEGGDAIDLDVQLSDESGAAAWQEKSFTSWLPRVRWIRMRLEFNNEEGSDDAFSAIDGISFSAVCKRYGPYSGFGELPEATWPELADAPDKAIPGWTGPEGDGITGGYTGMTLRNYVNPGFAGFADGVDEYTNSGMYIYNGFDSCPECITGRPFTDSGWNQQIICLGDMDIAEMADYFGPEPSGTYAPGLITATFFESPISNGEGHDFATFENGFVGGWTSDLIFAELAYVEVSSNGIDFIRFPTHSITPEQPGAYGTIIASGVFGMTGKHVNAYGDSWGTPFDLDWIADDPLVLNGTVDLNDIRYVRQVDIPGGGAEDALGSDTGFFYDSYGNPIFDSWPTWGSGGVDLDAVAVINSSAADSDGDHITDYWDNCSQSSNDNQYDTDEDGFGNMCDCDINGEEGGDGVVNYIDYQVFRAAYGGHGPQRIAGEPGEDDTYTDSSDNWNAAADFNGDNVVNYLDYQIFRARYGSSAPFD